MKKFRSIEYVYSSGKTYTRDENKHYVSSKSISDAYNLVKENVETNVLSSEVIELVTGVRSTTTGTVTENPIINYYSYLVQEEKLNYVLNKVQISVGAPPHRAVSPELNGKGYDALASYLSENIQDKDKPFKITTAGVVKKLRTPSGGRICTWSSLDNNQKALDILNDPVSVDVETIRNQNFFRVIAIVHLMHQFTSNLAQVNKMPPGISYEIDQIDTFNESLQGLPDLGFILPGSNDIYKEKEQVVLIDGAKNVEGVPKADMSLTYDDKDVFWISYKHGEYIDNVTKPSDIPFQQYGSPAGIYADKALKPVIDEFLTEVSNKVGNYYTRDQVIAIGEKNPDAEKGSMELIMNYYGKQINKKKKDGTPSSNRWNKNKVEDFYIYPSGTSEHAAKLFDSDRQPLGSELELLALKSIYGDDYTGKPDNEFGKNNVNILLQTPESAKFELFKPDKEDPDEVVAVKMSLVDKSHVIFNPNLPDSLPYLPCMYIRHTLDNYFIFNNKRTGKVSAILGGRLLVYPQGSVSSSATFIDMFE